MAVYRVNKTRGYTVMANYHLRDKNLSLKAVGLLSKMLSFNDGWQFSTKGLSMICKEGPDAVLAAIRELEDAGYLVRHQSRDEKGRMSSMIFEIYEKPQKRLPVTAVLMLKRARRRAPQAAKRKATTTPKRPRLSNCHCQSRKAGARPKAQILAMLEG